MRKVLELKGYKSLRALNVFHTLLLGLKMLPLYNGIDYRDFFESFKEMPDSEKETKLREALAFVELNKEEVGAIICFTTDPNGVPYTEANEGNLDPAELFECIIAVCMEIGRIKVDLVSEDEKKKLKTSQSI